MMSENREDSVCAFVVPAEEAPAAGPDEVGAVFETPLS